MRLFLLVKKNEILVAGHGNLSQFRLDNRKIFALAMQIKGRRFESYQSVYLFFFKELGKVYAY